MLEIRNMIPNTSTINYLYNQQTYTKSIKIQNLYLKALFD